MRANVICQKELTIINFLSQLDSKRKLPNINQLNKIQQNKHLIALMSLLTLPINESVRQLNRKDQFETDYFEDQYFWIDQQTRNIGEMVRILSRICHFDNRKSCLLAQFSTIQFRIELQSERQFKPLQLIYGIYPKINVHKDNIPLYMPLYQALNGYDRCQGNSDWQSWRQNLDQIYRKHFLATASTAQHDWYLLLVNSPKLLQKYSQNSIQRVWAYLYYYYMEKTLRPYRYLQNEFHQQVSLNHLIELIEKAIKSTQKIQLKSILILVTQILETSENKIILMSAVFNAINFKNQYLLPDERFIFQDTTLGFINCLFYQYCLNNKQLNSKNQPINSIREEKIDELAQQSIKLNQKLYQANSNYSDCYLRIFFPSNQKQSQQNILVQLIQRCQSSSEQFMAFPIYPYNQNILNKLSQVYFLKYPNQLLDYIQYMQKQKALERLLKTSQLDSDNWPRIKQILKKDIKQNIVFLNSYHNNFQVSDVDYKSFIKLWESYHEFCALIINQPSSQFQSCIFKTIQLIRSQRQMHINTKFKQYVSTPYKLNSSLWKILSLLISSLDNYFSNIQASQNQALYTKVVESCQKLITQTWFRTEILSNLQDEQKDTFWKKWSNVYLADQSLVNQIIQTNCN